MPINQGEKPEKPSPDFPLFSHASGKWGKRINGKFRYFGTWDDPAGALAEYKAFLAKQDTVSPPMLTVEHALNLFLHSKRDAMKAGKIEERTYKEHQRTCSRLANFVGKARDVMSLRPSDFASFQADRAKTMNLVSVGNEVTRVKTAFKWMHETGLITKPMRFGPDFRKPSRRAVRKLRNERGKQLFTQREIRLLLDESGIHLRAMILLGINAAYGPHDCAMLPLHAVDLESGWLDFARPKTEIDRLCPLWPETVEAMRVSLGRRPEPSSAARKRFFVEYSGKPFDNDTGDMSKYFTAVRRRVLPEGGFYWLRRTFSTVASASGDQVAVNYIMGHVDDSMAAVYRQEVQAERLVRVSNVVREWLFGVTADESRLQSSTP